MIHKHNEIIQVDKRHSYKSNIMNSDEKSFYEWLILNGARFPKIDWPSNETKSGMRGAIAKDDIECGEVMLEIPGKLMMCKSVYEQDEEIGHILSDSSISQSDDLKLSIYIMNEVRKKDKSFYYPYIKIIPSPDCAAEWNEEELSYLEDNHFISTIRGRRTYLQNMYDSTIGRLCDKHPTLFPLEHFSYTHFTFAWHSIMSRAFGRRLPFSAMVPFADCLNHANIATKYDYNIDNDDMFRMYPTNKNHYKKGDEVFNSYGRRKNDNLLLEYGFSMLDNEWDHIDVYITYEPENKKPDILYPRKSQLIRHKHYMRGKACISRSVNFKRSELPLDGMMFLRISYANEAELTLLETMMVKSSALSTSVELDTLCQQASNITINSTSLQQQTTTTMTTICYQQIVSLTLEEFILQIVLKQLYSIKKQWKQSIEIDIIEVKELIHLSRQPVLSTVSYTNDNHSTIKMNIQDNIEKEIDYIKVNEKSAAIHRKISAYIYRITRKRIIQITIERFELLQNIIHKTIYKEWNLEEFHESTRDFIQQVFYVPSYPTPPLIDTTTIPPTTINNTSADNINGSSNTEYIHLKDEIACNKDTVNYNHISVLQRTNATYKNTDDSDLRHMESTYPLSYEKYTIYIQELIHMCEEHLCHN